MATSLSFLHAMAVLSLPLSFTNSFWSQDYRRGLEVLYNKIEQVCTLFLCFLAVVLTPAVFRASRKTISSSNLFA